MYCCEQTVFELYSSLLTPSLPLSLTSLSPSLPHLPLSPPFLSPSLSLSPSPSLPPFLSPYLSLSLSLSLPPSLPPSLSPLRPISLIFLWLILKSTAPNWTSSGSTMSYRTPVQRGSSLPSNPPSPSTQPSPNSNASSRAYQHTRYV